MTDMTMSFAFKDTDFTEIAEVLQADARQDGDIARFRLSDRESGRSIQLEISMRLVFPDAIRGHIPDNLVTVMTRSSLLQLQGCTGFITSAELGEVIFFARRGGITNGMVVERQAGCSLYANFDNRLLSSDLTAISPELVMSTVALSMTETLFGDLS